MAIMTDADRFACWRDYQRDERHGAFGALTKADLRAAVNALDQFLSDNAAAINTAIPQPARAQLTVPQKALLLQFVIQKRYLAS